MPQGQDRLPTYTGTRKMAAAAVNVSEDAVIGFDDGAGLEAPLDCPEYSKEAEEILVGRTCSYFIFHISYFISYCKNQWTVDHEVVS